MVKFRNQNLIKNVKNFPPKLTNFLIKTLTIFIKKFRRGSKGEGGRRGVSFDPIKAAGEKIWEILMAFKENRTMFLQNFQKRAWSGKGRKKSKKREKIANWTIFSRNWSKFSKFLPAAPIGTAGTPQKSLSPEISSKNLYAKIDWNSYEKD